MNILIYVNTQCTLCVCLPLFKIYIRFWYSDFSELLFYITSGWFGKALELPIDVSNSWKRFLHHQLEQLQNQELSDEYKKDSI